MDRLAQDEPSDGSTVSDLVAVQNDAGETALYVAAENNLDDVFGYLLKFCDVQTVKIRSKSDMDAFHVAAKRGHLGILFFLISFFNFWSFNCEKDCKFCFSFVLSLKWVLNIFWKITLVFEICC